MRKINAGLFITLDGVVEAPGSSDVTLPERRGWTEPFFVDEMGAAIAERLLHERSIDGHAPFVVEVGACDRTAMNFGF